MRGKFTILAVLCFVLSFLGTTAQNSAAKYRRSSLHTILIESSTFPKKDTVLKAYFNAPFPDKYNQHDIGVKSFDPLNYRLTAEEKTAAGVEESGKFGKMMKGAASSATDGVVDSLAGDMRFIIEKYIKQEKIGNKIVAKWFNRKGDGTCDQNLINERGCYDASYLKAKEAEGAALGALTVSDDDDELIRNSFVVFNKLTFMKNETAAAIVRDLAKAAVRLKTSNPLVLKGADIAADKLYEATKDGYTVVNKAFLFQLKWNHDSVYRMFEKLYLMPNKDASVTAAAFDNANFELEYVGEGKSSSIVLFSAGKSEEQIITLATVRNVDNTYAKLQKTYPVFRPVVPIYSNDPVYTAKLGMKEGLSGGEKFEVLRKEKDPKTGKIVYNRIGKIKVKKGQVWDNRFSLVNPGEAKEPEMGKDGKPIPVLTATSFKQGKKYSKGTLIKQLK